MIGQRNRERNASNPNERGHNEFNGDDLSVAACSIHPLIAHNDEDNRIQASFGIFSEKKNAQLWIGVRRVVVTIGPLLMFSRLFRAQGSAGT